MVCHALREPAHQHGHGRDEDKRRALVFTEHLSQRRNNDPESLVLCCALVRLHALTKVQTIRERDDLSLEGQGLDRPERSGQTELGTWPSLAHDMSEPLRRLDGLGNGIALGGQCATHNALDGGRRPEKQ